MSKRNFTPILAGACLLAAFFTPAKAGHFGGGGLGGGHFGGGSFGGGAQFQGFGYRLVHGPGSSHNPIIYRPPLHGPGSSHYPIVYHPPVHGPGSSHNPIVCRPGGRPGSLDCRGVGTTGR